MYDLVLVTEFYVNFIAPLIVLCCFDALLSAFPCWYFRALDGPSSVEHCKQALAANAVVCGGRSVLYTCSY